MNNDNLKALAQIASENEEKIPTNVKNFLLTKLNKRDLKTFLRYFRNILKEKRVYVESSDILSKEYQKELKKKFVGKKLIFEINKNIGTGIKITENDTIYNFTFKKYLDDTIEQLRSDF